MKIKESTVGRVTPVTPCYIGFAAPYQGIIQAPPNIILPEEDSQDYSEGEDDLYDTLGRGLSITHKYDGGTIFVYEVVYKDNDQRETLSGLDIYKFK